MITHQFLLENFHYDATTGVMIRLKAMGAGKAGGTVGSSHNMGYLRVMLFRKSYLLHRFIWFYMYGKWPDRGIDHINGIKTDNRLCNLREASQSQNMANRGPQQNNRSGYKGVYWCSTNQKWVARVQVRRKVHSLGYFRNLEDAVEAYRVGAAQLLGEYARAA